MDNFKVKKLMRKDMAGTRILWKTRTKAVLREEMTAKLLRTHRYLGLLVLPSKNSQRNYVPRNPITQRTTSS